MIYQILKAVLVSTTVRLTGITTEINAMELHCV